MTLSWKRRSGGSSTARWKGTWFRIKPHSFPIGWALSWGTGEIERGYQLYLHKDDAIEAANRIAQSKETEQWQEAHASL